jgi:hypothetical protein
MSESPSVERELRCMEWRHALACAAALAAATTACLLWLLYSYVPLHCAMFELLDLQLPRPTMLVVEASLWFSRSLLPVIVLATTLPGAILAAMAFRAARTAGPRLSRRLAATVFLIALVEASGCAFVVYAAQVAYSSALSNPAFKKALAAFQTVKAPVPGRPDNKALHLAGGDGKPDAARR